MTESEFSALTCDVLTVGIGSILAALVLLIVLPGVYEHRHWIARLWRRRENEIRHTEIRHLGTYVFTPEGLVLKLPEKTPSSPKGESTMFKGIAKRLAWVIVGMALVYCGPKYYPHASTAFSNALAWWSPGVDNCSRFGRTLAEMLDSPDEWQFTPTTLEHKRGTGVEMDTRGHPLPRLRDGKSGVTTDLMPHLTEFDLRVIRQRRDALVGILHDRDTETIARHMELQRRQAVGREVAEQLVGAR